MYEIKLGKTNYVALVIRISVQKRIIYYFIHIMTVTTKGFINLPHIRNESYTW